MSKVFVHIGPGKTGTTSFQKYLQKLDPNFIKSPDLRDLVVQEGNAGRKRLAELLSQENHRNIVLSSEFLMSRHDEFFRFISEARLDIKRFEILIVAREHVSHFRSRLQQHLKATHKPLRPESAINYQKLITNWGSNFNVTVFPYESSGQGPDSIVNRLVEHTNLSIDWPLNGPPPREIEPQNVGDPAEVTFLLAQYFRLMYPEEPRKFREDASRARKIFLSSYQKIAKSSSFQPAELTDELKTFIRSLRQSDREYLSSEWGIHFEDPTQNSSEQHSSKSNDFSDLQNMLKIDNDLAMYVLLSSLSFMNP